MYLLHIEGPLLPPRQVVLLLPARATTFTTGLECVHSNLFVSPNFPIQAYPSYICWAHAQQNMMEHDSHAACWMQDMNFSAAEIMRRPSYVLNTALPVPSNMESYIALYNNIAIWSK